MECAVEIRQGLRSLALFTGTWVVLVVLVGCSGVTYQAANDASTNGIRYYSPATYLLVKPDYDNQTATLEWFNLADTSKPFAAKPYAYMATNTIEIEFKNGILVKVDSETNSAAVPKAFIGALNNIVQSALQTAAKAAAASAGFMVSPRDKDAKGPQSIFLFKIEDDGSGRVVKQLYPVPESEVK